MTSQFARRQVLRAGALGAGTLITGTIRGARAQAGPLRVPVLFPLSGPLAPVGLPARQGAEIALRLINAAGGVAGRQIEASFIDDKARPTDATGLVREQIAAGNKVVLGLVLSAQLAAVVPVMEETKSVLITSAGQGVAWTHESFSRYVFPGLDNDVLRARALAQLTVAKFPDVTRFHAVISDSKSYIDSYDNFRKLTVAALAAAGKQAPEFLPPLVVKIGTTDFRQQIAEVSNSNADAFYNFVIGADGITFWQQARAYGLGDKFKAVVDQTLDILQLKALKKNMPGNLWTLSAWWHGLHSDNPLSEAIYKAYVAETKDAYPSGFLHYGAVIVQALQAALEGAHGNTDAEAIITALEGRKFNAPKGEMYFRKEDHMLLGAEDFIKVVSAEEEPGLRVVDGYQLSTVGLAPPPTPGKPYEG